MEEAKIYLWSCTSKNDLYLKSVFLFPCWRELRIVNVLKSNIQVWHLSCEFPLFLQNFKHLINKTYDFINMLFQIFVKNNSVIYYKQLLFLVLLATSLWYIGTCYAHFVTFIHWHTYKNEIFVIGRLYLCLWI